MTKSQKSNTRGQVRSVSLPTRSHPTTLRIDEELKKLDACESSSTLPTAGTVSNGLIGLENLYKCVDELLNLPSTQQVISQYKLEKWVDELMDGSVRLLDTCGNTKDLVSQMKVHLGDVRSCLRRRKGESSIESSITKFTSFRKKMKKDVKKLIGYLKQMDNEIVGSRILDLDQHVSAVIRVLREVSAMSIYIFQSLLAFLSVPVSKPNQTKWLLVSNLMRKGRVACEGQVDNGNELERVDAALSSLCKYGSSETEKMQIAQKKLEVLEARVEEIESGLECIFRCLIRTRASFLNIVSQ
ncbi:hypothetical protein LguiA_013910 [Lonicera macranthoides]